MLKLIMAACLLALAHPAVANQYGNPYVEMVHADKPVGACLDNGMLFFYVVKAIDKDIYEIEARHDGQVVMRGMLQVSKTHFSRPGLIHVEGLRLQFLEMKDLPLDNGFNEKFALWRECK